ncbi:MAG: CHASE2 domain-containing protein [Bacteroidales bacterium]|jgi:CHASE2 domain-containing sensor protein|nr:CHASE2 domain-containing protein [Bacteroidales bacterium]HOL97890.1 CHASE2 domain-containing protein [Bacteroidales bacterium]HOM35634.1 CHASE2 domain-containing protein [Bacteroidales bacterium]HPD22805.1 CHASE2 domain-containing protein [Bacteroidales bacterium]HRS98932.1 CHASE2 domain-containing protein [Bacteroidales bacterium]
MFNFIFFTKNKNKTLKEKKYTVFWDSLIINIFTGLAVFLFWAIIDSMDFFNPLDEFIDNFDFTDLYFSEFQPEEPTDTNIFIVNIGNLNRKEIADLIFKIQKFEPRVIGIDAVFAERRGPEDFYLRQALNSGNNIILGAFGKYENDNPVGIIKSDEFFGDLPVGHLEMILYPRVVREFDKFIRYNDTIVNSFSMEVISKYDKNIFLNYAQRKNQTELINYRGGRMPFIIFDYEEISDTNENLIMLKDKIVLLGYVRMFAGAPADTLDAFFTPQQKSEYGYPDAKGIEVHAHIISMILSGVFLKKVPIWLNYLIAFIILQLFIMWLVYYYVNGEKYFDILSKPIQFLLIVIVLWISFYLISKFLIKFDMLPTVLALVLCIDVLYLYEETMELFKIDTYLTQKFKYTKEDRKQVMSKIFRIFKRNLNKNFL